MSNLLFLFPEVVAAVEGVGVVLHLGLTPEELLRHGIELIVRQSRRSYDEQVLQQLRGVDLGNHIVLREHPLAIVELGVFLIDAHVVNPVDVALLWHIEVDLAHMQRRVGQYIQFAAETEVLLVGGDELQMVAFILVDVGRVLDVEMIEGNRRKWPLSRWGRQTGIATAGCSRRRCRRR